MILPRPHVGVILQCCKYIPWKWSSVRGCYCFLDHWSQISGIRCRFSNKKIFSMSRYPPTDMVAPSQSRSCSNASYIMNISSNWSEPFASLNGIYGLILTILSVLKKNQCSGGLRKAPNVIRIFFVLFWRVVLSLLVCNFYLFEIVSACVRVKTYEGTKVPFLAFSLQVSLIGLRFVYICNHALHFVYRKNFIYQNVLLKPILHSLFRFSLFFFLGKYKRLTGIVKLTCESISFTISLHIIYLGLFKKLFVVKEALRYFGQKKKRLWDMSN